MNTTRFKIVNIRLQRLRWLFRVDTARAYAQLPSLGWIAAAYTIVTYCNAVLCKHVALSTLSGTRHSSQAVSQSICLCVLYYVTLCAAAELPAVPPESMQ
jgi:hypothetical protein